MTVASIYRNYAAVQADDVPISSFFWLWVPVIFIIVHLALQLYLPSEILTNLLVEAGPYEAAQAVIMSAVCIIAFISACRATRRKQKLLAGWLWALALGSFYVAGEEVSWGQHIWNWSTPEYWAGLNKDQETNLHETTNWLDRKPKALLEAGIFIGGLLIPFLQRFRSNWIPMRWAVLYPPATLVVTASVLAFAKIIEPLDSVLNIFNFIRFSEVNELYVYYFLLLYAAILCRRVTL